MPYVPTVAEAEDMATAKAITTPMHPRPACYWESLSRADERMGRRPMRHANIYHRDKVGELVIQISGWTTEVDEIARRIAAGEFGRG